MTVDNLEIEVVENKEPNTVEEEVNDATDVIKIEGTEEEKRITKEFFVEFDAIKKEREESGLEEKWDLCDAQYDGCLDEVEEQQFNVHIGLTKEQVDGVTAKIMSAFMESDPRFAYSPRPEFSKQDGQRICEGQENFVDYSMDEVIPYREPKEMQVRSAVLKGNGILKWDHLIKTKKYIREESWKGNPRPVFGKDANGQLVPVGIQNEELNRFLKAYPDAQEKYPGIVKALNEGKKRTLKVSEERVVYNDPFPSFVDLKNFYVRLSTEGNFGLEDQKCIVERITYNWHELQALKKKPWFFKNIDKMKFKDLEATELLSDYATKEYKILEAEFNTEIDGEDVKLILWFSEDLKIMIGARYFGFYSIPTRYQECHIIKRQSGFYQPGLAETLTDDNITLDAFINILLEGLYSQNLITPIVKAGSSTELQFLERQAGHGIPIITDDGQPIRFFNEAMRQIDTGSMITAMQYIKQSAEGKTHVTSLITGRESPTDPNAPATKTLALLGEANTNIKMYILSIMPSFVLDARYVLDIYYQIIDETNVKYRKKGTNDFLEINREDLIARTNIQSMAYAFALDRANEKRENLALLQIAMSNPLITQDPEKVYYLFRSVIKSWSAKWRNEVDKILPTPQELKQKMLSVAAMGAQAMAKKGIAEAQLTGQRPQIDPRIYVELLNVLEKQLTSQQTEQDQATLNSILGMEK